MCMYVRMYVCMYEGMYVCVCMYVCVYVCVYDCMYDGMYVCMHVCMYARVYVHMYVCMYACAHEDGHTSEVRCPFLDLAPFILIVYWHLPISEIVSGLTKSKMAFGLALHMFFCRFEFQVRGYGLELRSSILPFQGASIGVHGNP